MVNLEYSTVALGRHRDDAVTPQSHAAPCRVRNEMAWHDEANEFEILSTTTENLVSRVNTSDFRDLGQHRGR